MRSPSLHELPAPPAGKTGWPWTEETPRLPERMPDGRPWPRISIVTPSYNQAHFIEETLRSVLLQGYPDLEFLVLDGGSSDGSAEIIRSYAPWLAYWRSERDSGQAAAIAEGLQRSTGEIQAYLNSDDCYHKHALGRVGRYMARRPHIALLNGDLNIIDSDSRVTHRHFVSRPIRSIAANLGYHTWPQPACFWRRWAYQKTSGVDATLRFCMDRDLFLKLTAVGPAARLPGKPTADFRNHSDAKSSTIVHVAEREGRILIERHGSRLGRSPLYRSWLVAQWRAVQAFRGMRRRFARLGIEI